MGRRAVGIAVEIAVGITSIVAIAVETMRAVGDLAGLIYQLSMVLCSCGGKTSLT